MNYAYREEIELSEKPSMNWNKNTPKEILQYTLGGLLYMPATNVKIVDDIINRKYSYLKSLVLCLEDSIGDAMIEEAEKCVKIILTKLYQALKEQIITIDELPLIFIRVREHGQMTRLCNNCNESMEVITGFVLPKFDKINAFKYVEEFKAIVDKTKLNIYILPIIESKNAMFKQIRMENLIAINNAIKPISKYILGIRVGGADFCSIFGVRRSIEHTIWDIKVVADCLADIINVFGRNYIVSGPVWEYFGKDRTGKWAEGLRKELEMDYTNGIIGKTAIHPTQLPIIQESLIVSYENYKDAINIMGMQQDIIGVQKGYGNDKMNEVKTHSNWAKKIICLANIYGVQKEK